MQTTDVTEGNDIWFVGRVLRPDNVILSRDDIASSATALQVRVYDLSRDSLSTGANGREVHSADFADGALTTLLLTATSSSPLTNDGYWDGVDDVGYNFKLQLAWDQAKYEAGHRYQIEFAFLTDSYGSIRWAQQFFVRSLLAV
jgi:hypothetical protein